MERHHRGHNNVDRSSEFPPLSPTIQASQLLTPLQLERLSIDDPHYCSHLNHSVMTTQPPQHNAVQRRVNKMGDNYFFLQKDIPVNQTYAKTALQLSEVRPWDQIVDRPMSSYKVVEKELDLPFPQEHPYTSHISRFAVFPHTNRPTPSHHQVPRPPSYGSSTIQDDSCVGPTATVSVETQTGPWVSSVGVPKSSTPYYVPQKASEWGQRVECQYLSTTANMMDNTRGPADPNNMLWDLPRSQRHKRAYTYPSPSLQYGQPLAPPSALPVATRRVSPHPVSPNTQQALNTIHSLLTRTTTYSEQYPGTSTATKARRHTPNILCLDNSFRSRESQRPWTAESRGKYSRRLPTTPYTSTTAPKTPLFAEGTKTFDSSYYDYLQDKERGMDTQGEDQPKYSAREIGTNLSDEAGTTKVDQGTQTEEEYFVEPHESTQTETMEKLPSLTSGPPTEDTKGADEVQVEYKLPQIANSNPPMEGQQQLSPVLERVQPAELNRPASAFTFPQHTQQSDQLRHKRSLSANNYIPRTVESTRRLNSLYNGFSRAETLKRFHEQYPENAPDLRHYSIREGKRHVIHGSHAYYFH